MIYVGSTSGLGTARLFGERNRMARIAPTALRMMFRTISADQAMAIACPVFPRVGEEKYVNMPSATIDSANPLIAAPINNRDRDLEASA
jgi:hypothetical protein